MKPKKQFECFRSFRKGYPKRTRRVKPLSYYVAGGADVDGDALKQDGRSMSDPDADADTWMSLFGSDADGEPIVFTDPFCDPRHDVFSIASMAGASNFKAAVRKAQEDAQAAKQNIAAAAAADTATDTAAPN